MALKEQPKSPLTVKFQQYELSSGVAFYKILVTDIDYHKTWSLPKVRYSELRKLHLQIQQQYSQQLPDFPPKKFFGNLEPSFLSQRSKALEIYLNNTLKYFNINQLPKLKQFLCPDGLSERPEKNKSKEEEQKVQQQQQAAQQQQTSNSKEKTKSPQIGPQQQPKLLPPEQKLSQAKAPNSQNRPDLDQMIENIKLQFIYISNPSDHEQEPYESKNSTELAKKKCIKNGQQRLVGNLGLDGIKQQKWEQIVKEECFVGDDRELLEAIDMALENFNANFGKLEQFCKFTKNQEPMEIIHYIQPQLFQAN